jgi:hypothetical protein
VTCPVTRVCQAGAVRTASIGGVNDTRDAMDHIDTPTVSALTPCELEFWAPIAEAPAYDVSTWGRVRRDDRLIESWPNKKGYHLVSLEIEGRDQLRYVHRLVLMAFVGPGPGRLANHHDGRKGNNGLHNLSWTTPSGNMQHAWATGLMPRTRAARATCRFGHPRTLITRGADGRRPRLHCPRCRRAASWRRWAALVGLVPLPQLLG